ncbi:hypothetical protein SNEBB_010347 [Seison nebaliae]|nr:hypothetical protein SNEBB_010347 [Seison nebaliae]
MGHDNLAIGRPSAYGLIDDLGIQLISKSDSIVNYYQLCFYAHNIPSIPITVPTIEYEISEWLLGVMGTNLGINSKAANKTN